MTNVRIPRADRLAAVLSGLMLTASFPPGTTDWLAWVAWSPCWRP